MDQKRWKAAKLLVRERDGDQCLRCYSPADEVHHRIVRGMGGTGDDEVNYGLANLVCICRECHTHVHANPSESYETGFLVHWWMAPERIPLIAGSYYSMLTTDGDTKVVHPVLPF